MGQIGGEEAVLPGLRPATIAPWAPASPESGTQRSADIDELAQMNVIAVDVTRRTDAHAFPLVMACSTSVSCSA